MMLSPRWGGVSRCPDTPNPAKTASPLGVCRASSCNLSQNDAGTCHWKWHKSDTGGSASVPIYPPPEIESAAPSAKGNGANEGLDSNFDTYVSLGDLADAIVFRVDVCRRLPKPFRTSLWEGWR